MASSDDAAGKAPPFSGSALLKYQAADAVVVAQVARIRPIRTPSQVDIPRGIPAFACQIDLSVLHTIKGRIRQRVPTVWLTVNDCSESWRRNGIFPSASGIFFLAQKAGIWRPISDEALSPFVNLKDRGTDVVRVIQAERDPLLALAVAHVYADTNIWRVSFNEKWGHHPSSLGVWDLVGLERVPQLLNEVFRHSDEEGRLSICFLASEFGLCTGCVAKYLYRHRDRDLWEPVVLHREKLIEDQLRPNTLRELEREMRTKGTETRTQLRFYSCHSKATIRARARTLLRQLFQDHEAPQCVPCDADWR